MTDFSLNFNALTMLASFLAGAGIAAIYLVLLWVSVRVLLQYQQAMLFALLGVVRGLVVIGGLWLAIKAGLSAIDIISALLGFITLRVLATRLVKPPSHEGATWK